MTKQILLSLLNCSWQWMLLSGLIWFVVTRFRRSNTTVHLLWLLSLLSLPILFGLNQFVPALSIGGNPVPELVEAKPINVSGLAALTIDLPEISSAESDTQSKNQLFADGKSFVDWAKTDLLLYLWAIGALAMLVRFMFGLYRIYQLRHSAVVADDSYQAICERLVRHLRIKRQVTVCFSDQVASPISFGWLSPLILIPRKLNLEQFELVAAHELAHVQRLDWLTNLFSHLVGVIFFFHPIYHLLNRELVHLRERICDDWVIQLTGARKNYAQCLLDLVRHKDRAVPLALSLNQPSQLESRIDSILKSNRRLDVQLKPRLQLMAATLLLTCLPLLAMAQLVPLKTFQISLFAQTPEKSEKAVDKTEKKQVMEKAKDGKMDGKQYKDDSRIKVKDPALFEQSEENKIFSGPQPGEKLPSLMVTGIDGKLDGQTYAITAEADGKPLVLFLQDTNGVGVKGLVNVFELLLKIDAFQKRDSKATGAEKANEGLQIGVVFLADNLDTLPEWAHNMLNEEIPNEILTGISPDGREGPGSYGLNRNVAQTVLIAKDGKVLHNFAFTQPMLYSDPHFLGAVADAIGADAPALEKWLNDDAAKRRYEKNVKAAIIKEIDDTSGGAHNWLELRNLTDNELNLKGWTVEIDTTELDTKEKLTQFTNTDNELNLKGWTVEIDTTELDAERWLIRFKEDVKLPANGFLLLDAESLKKLGVTLEEGEKLLNEKKDNAQTMRKERWIVGAKGSILRSNDDAHWEEGEKLLNEKKDNAQTMRKERWIVGAKGPILRSNDDAQMMRRERRYENRRQVEVKDPTSFGTSKEKPLFSGPQAGEKLPPLMATGIRGRTKGKTFDFIAKTNEGKPLILFLQDGNGAGLEGLYDISRMIAKIANESKQELHISVVFLGDDPDALKQKVGGVASGIAKNGYKNLQFGISPDGREGPGSYGLNRNVSQTILIAKDGKVLHNFAFTQPTGYADSHVLGAIAQVIGADPASVEKWLNEASPDEERMQGDRRRMGREGARKSEQDRSLEELVKQFDKDGDGKLNKEEGTAMRRTLVNRESQNRYRRENVEVKNPTEFKKVQGATLFSGPQPGEKLPPLMAKGINGDVKDKIYDVIAKAGGQPLVLFLQDESGLGLRGLVGISRLLAQIVEKSEQKMHISAVFLGDTPDTVENQASRLVSHIPSGVLLSISQDGREGPGSYGLNRSVAQTVIIAKDGKVLHNFAFTQPMLRPDPYLLGAVGEAIGVKPATLEKLLNEKGLVIKINNPTVSDKMGKMLLNGTVVQFDEMGSRFSDLPEEQKSMLTIQSGRDVPHEQIVKVMDIAKEAGIDKIGFAIDSAEGERMQRGDTSEETRALIRLLREMVEKGEITGEEARE